MMKFTVIGHNPAASELLREIASAPDHMLTACSISGELGEAVTRHQLPLRLASNPEDAILAPGVDAVIIAIDDLDDILRLARAASQAERHVIVVPPALCSPAFSFELHLILDESSRAIVPLIGRFALDELSVEQRELGLNSNQTLQLSIEMSMESTTPAAIRRSVQQGLDVLSSSGFRYSQVTALESQAPDGTFLSRLITLNSQPTAEITLPPATLTLKRSTMPTAEGTRLRNSRADGSTQDLLIANSSAILPRIVYLCENREQSSKWMESFSTTLELTEAVDKSLRRRRTVDVHFDTGSERGVFKSQMTAIGCGVLMYMMVGMVAYLVAAQLIEFPNWVLHAARVLWVLPLVLFLLFQTLLPVARKRSLSR